MASSIAVIVEGAKQEKKYFQSMERVFFADTELDIFIFSGRGNIYTLWQQMQADEFDTDIIEILREKNSSFARKLDGKSRRDFQEVYLFYDYDPQQDNASNTYMILGAMLKVFDNETENGKLYISYPMSEALRDIRPDSCVPYTSCWLQLMAVDSYKESTGLRNKYAHAGAYKVNEWQMILQIYIRRLECFYGLNNALDIFANDKKLNSPLSIFEKEQEKVNSVGEIFILSAFPEFLVDYFPAERMIKFAEVKMKACDNCLINGK